METSIAIQPLSHQISLLFPTTPRRSRACGPYWPSKRPVTTRIRCQKMYVPGFGEASPEAKAAKNLHNFFTYVAVRIVTAQLESYNPEAYEELMEFLSRHSLNDGDKFCADLMRESSRHKNLALRILEVRSAYCKNDFEWDNLQRLSAKILLKVLISLSDILLETLIDRIEGYLKMLTRSMNASKSISDREIRA